MRGGYASRADTKHVWVSTTCRVSTTCLVEDTKHVESRGCICEQARALDNKDVGAGEAVESLGRKQWLRRSMSWTWRQDALTRQASRVGIVGTVYPAAACTDSTRLH